MDAEEPTQARHKSVRDIKSRCQCAHRGVQRLSHTSVPMADCLLALMMTVALFSGGAADASVQV